MSKEECRCGKASITYEPTEEEDQWYAEATNTMIKKDGYGETCFCRSCGEVYDNFDPCMVVEINHTER